MDQSANKLALVEPSNFNFNTETFDTNVFQNDVQFNKLKIFEEFDNFISTLDKNKISFNILKSPKNSPDSIYPNNWVVTFEDGTYDLFSMQSPNRRIERSNSNINFLNTNYSLKNDLTEYEAENIFLEGTGSLVLDRVNKNAYMAESNRSNVSLASKWSQLRGYDLVHFKSYIDKKPTYHTNVLMFITNKFAGICFDSISDSKNLLSNIEKTHKILNLSIEQVKNFSGNAIVVRNINNEAKFLISSSGLKAFDLIQKRFIEKYYDIVDINIPTIEKIGGGSVRCMLLELF
ncbi:MAG: hypothetical protein CM15mP11_03630 [Gammaproteobacteria bacterium]|nr:MAG: hypothetical protein CM15mP11_03630 [Gammaproteobacteria bacterium]